MEQKILKCQRCGNVVMMMEDSGVPIMCCGEKMQELVPGTSDGAAEKHVPVYEIKDNKVLVVVGEVAHPMLPEHHIAWISIRTNMGRQIKYLEPGEEPKACFSLCEGEKVEAVYEYCNLHGLWKA